MGPTSLLKQILELPPEQRLRLVEDIWDSLAQSDGEVPMPEWHRAELDRRLADRNVERTVGWHEVERRLKHDP